MLLDLILEYDQLVIDQYQLSLSINSVPLKPLNGFGIFLDLLLFKVKFNALYNVCKINVDLPLPDTPVTQVKLPKGIFKLTLF